MPARRTPLVTGEYYHIFNRGVARQPTFFGKRYYDHFIQVMEYYRFSEVPTSYARYRRANRSGKDKILARLYKKGKSLVDILCYCLMPNHYHFLLLQRENEGISRFMSNMQNSYVRFVNTREDRVGPLFQGRFRAVHVEGEEQFFHLSRYIHLNPHTSHVIKSLKDLDSYEYSSFPFYITKKEAPHVDTSMIMSHYKKPERYKEFVYNNAGYQRSLKAIQHLTLD